MARTKLEGSALFIGHAYVDVTLPVETIPTGDEKVVASDCAVSFGGNAVTSAFCCARLGFTPDLLSSSANDWAGKLFAAMVQKYGIHWHERHVNRFAIASILPNQGKRAMARYRDTDYLHGFPLLDMSGCKALHLDGHQPLAAMHYAKECRAKGILTSLDAGDVRENTDELLDFIDVAICSELFCQKMGKDPEQLLHYLRHKGCKVGGVTFGERGMLWYQDEGDFRRLSALRVPKDLVIDTNGAGDVFRGGYMYSYLRHPERSWEEHFIFARAVSAFKVQHLGNEAGLPSVEQVESIIADLRPVAAQAA